MIKKLLLFIISLMIPVIIGFAASQLSGQSAVIYEELVKPPLSPPAYIFGIVWTILYVMMGISSFIILISKAKVRDKVWALSLYGLQLFMNFFWTFIFFNLGWKLFAFLWLVILWLMIIFLMDAYRTISKLSTYLIIPYFLWVTFAGYLNIALYLLNIS